MFSQSENKHRQVQITYIDIKGTVQHFGKFGSSTTLTIISEHSKETNHTIRLVCSDYVFF